MVEYEPGHPNANIHGMIETGGEPTCRTRGGDLCTGCCYALRVEDPSSGFEKEAGEMCSEQAPRLGCKFILENRDGRPTICGIYHCSGDILESKINPDERKRLAAYQRLAMANLASRVNGETDQDQYERNLERLEQSHIQPEVKDDLPFDAPDDDVLGWLSNNQE